MSLRTDLINLLSHGDGLTRNTIYSKLKEYPIHSIRARLSELEKNGTVTSNRTISKEADVFSLTPKEIITNALS